LARNDLAEQGVFGKKKKKILRKKPTPSRKGKYKAVYALLNAATSHKLYFEIKACI